jgi:exonuclease III
MHQMRVDLGILTETKIDNDMYTRDCCGYMIFATHSKSQFQGGVALFYQTENPRWCIEGEMAHGQNVISCILISGDHRWNLLGVYIPPSEDDGETMNFLTEAIQYRGSCYPYILLGDLNVDLNGLEDICTDTIAAHLALYDFQDVGDHFKHPRGRWTWSQQCQIGHYLQSRTDYVMAQNVSDF